MKNRPTSRKIAVQVLSRFERDRSRLDDLIAEHIKDQFPDPRDRRYIKRVTAGVVRNLSYLDWIIMQFYRKNYNKAQIRLKNILRLAIFEIIYMDAIPNHATVNEFVELAKAELSHPQSRVVNGILRNLLRTPDLPDPAEKIEDEAQKLSVLYSFPVWLVKRWLALWGRAETEQLLAAFNKTPRYELAVNTARISTKDFLAKLKEHKIDFEQSRLAPELISVKNMQQVRESGLLEEGWCSVHDESAHIPVMLLEINDGQVVLDMCSAPGGKLIQILQQNRQITALAVDSNLPRLRRARENIQRLGLGPVHFVVADGLHLPFKPVFDNILLDAPCSGLGVIGKHPDIKWRRSMAEITQFSHLQSGLLNNAAEVLKPGGRLVYSTCTIDPLEDEDVVERFSTVRHEMKRLSLPAHLDALSQANYIRTFPHRHGTDGSFAVVFQKINTDT